MDIKTKVEALLTDTALLRLSALQELNLCGNSGFRDGVVDEFAQALIAVSICQGPFKSMPPEPQVAGCSRLARHRYLLRCTVVSDVILSDAYHLLPAGAGARRL